MPVMQCDSFPFVSLQVTVMQEEMAAVQPKLAEASKEVDSSMVLVEKEQSEVADLEKVVKSEDGLVNEKKKLAEQIRSDCDGELAEVSAGIYQQEKVTVVSTYEVVKYIEPHLSHPPSEMARIWSPYFFQGLTG